MQMLLYGELTPWYRLLDPVADHADEAAAYAAALARGGAASGGTLLELGAGAGGNAFFLKRQYRCTLTDISPGMLALSRALNPECEHLPGDMRTTVTLTPVIRGVDMQIVQEGIPAVIPPEMCYLGWQESLEQLAKLVEPEIPG